MRTRGVAPEAQCAQAPDRDAHSPPEAGPGRAPGSASRLQTPGNMIPRDSTRPSDSLEDDSLPTDLGHDDHEPAGTLAWWHVDQLQFVDDPACSSTADAPDEDDDFDVDVVELEVDELQIIDEEPLGI